MSSDAVPREGCDLREVVGELAESGGVTGDAVPGEGGDLREVVGELAESGGVTGDAVPGEGGDLREVVDELAQTGRSTHEAIIVVTPVAEFGVLLVVGERLTHAVGGGSVGCVGDRENLLFGTQGVVGASGGIDFTDEEVGAVGPVDGIVGGGVATRAYDESDEAVGVGLRSIGELIDHRTGGGSLADAQHESDDAFRDKLAVGIADDHLVVESTRHLCENAAR